MGMANSRFHPGVDIPRPKDVMAAKLRFLFERTGRPRKEFVAYLRENGFPDATAGKVSKLQSGEHVISPDYAVAIVRFFGVDRGWFLDGDPTSPVPTEDESRVIEDRAFLMQLIDRIGIDRATAILLGHAVPSGGTPEAGIEHPEPGYLDRKAAAQEGGDPATRKLKG